MQKSTYKMKLLISSVSKNKRIKKIYYTGLHEKWNSAAVFFKGRKKKMHSKLFWNAILRDYDHGIDISET